MGRPAGVTSLNINPYDHMRIDRLHRTRVTTFTFAFLALYAPIETWYSFPQLWDPFYIVDFAGMMLLIVGAVRLRRAGPTGGLGLLIAGYAWTAANFWRALFGRLEEIRSGGVLDYGALELCFTTCILLAAIVGLAWSLVMSPRLPSDSAIPPTTS